MLSTSIRTGAQQQEVEVTRRECLNYAWLASLGIFLAQIGGVTYLFAMPRFRAGEFGGGFSLGPASELPQVGAEPENNAQGLWPSGYRFWLVRSDEGVYALYVVCTHLGCLYQWRPTEDQFICPCHGSVFTRTGEYVAGPAPRSLDSFVVRVMDDQGNVLAETPPVDSVGPVPTPIPDPNARVVVDTGVRMKGKKR
jgi:cytochrome b6-f complex iron-sulfur subunit